MPLSYRNFILSGMTYPADLEGILLAAHEPIAPSLRGLPVTALPMVLPGLFECEPSRVSTVRLRDRRISSSVEAVPLVIDLRIFLETDGLPRPLAGAQVDVEHLGAEGRSSDLRGVLHTGTDGRVLFRTVFPGWRPDCPPQVRLRVRTMLDAHRHAAFASPLFFPDTLADAIYEWSPYHPRPVSAARNAQDAIFGCPLAGGGRAGDVLTLVPRPDVSGHGFVVRRDVVLLSPSRPLAYVG